MLFASAGFVARIRPPLPTSPAHKKRPSRDTLSWAAGHPPKMPTNFGRHDANSRIHNAAPMKAITPIPHAHFALIRFTTFSYISPQGLAATSRFCFSSTRSASFALHPATTNGESSRHQRFATARRVDRQVAKNTGASNPIRRRFRRFARWNTTLGQLQQRPNLELARALSQLIRKRRFDLNQAMAPLFYLADTALHIFPPPALLARFRFTCRVVRGAGGRQQPRVVAPSVG